MFKILQKTVSTGTVTVNYPAEPARISERFRGRPVFDFEKWKDARPGAEVCPTGAISVSDEKNSRRVTVDYGLCVFCGLCAEASSDQAVRISREFELATTDRPQLVLHAEYALNSDGTHRALRKVDQKLPDRGTDIDAFGHKTRATIHKILGRSLAIREVDAGSCNGCELEIVALNNPVHDIERFGVHFVASPRHADGIFVTGPVTENMREALLKTYEAVPEPKIVIASGACAINGGPFIDSPEAHNGVEGLLPVDLYIPGCPPHPITILDGLLRLLGRMEER